METDIELTSAHWRLRLQPHCGLQTQSCQILHAQQWHDLMPDCRASDGTKTEPALNTSDDGLTVTPSPTAAIGTPLKASNFHMLPYSNRIRDGRFNFNEQVIELEDGENHSIHGALRKLAWRVTDQSSNSVTAEYDTQQDGPVNWPWPIHSVITYTLDDNQLLSKMSLTNHGATKMPAGMGWHPYFCRTIAGSEPELTISVGGAYPDSHGDCLPTGAAEPLSKQLDFKKARKLDASVRIDHCLADFRSPAILHWPSAGVRIQMHASANCNHLVLFNPEQPYFAVEPVTNANDGFNLAAQGVAAGVTELEPGQTLHADMRLVLEN